MIMTGNSTSSKNKIRRLPDDFYNGGRFPDRLAAFGKGQELLGQIIGPDRGFLSVLQKRIDFVVGTENAACQTKISQDRCQNMALLI